MRKLITNTERQFDIEWAAPVLFTEDFLFYAKILNSSYPEVNAVFSDPNETEVLTVAYVEDEHAIIEGTYYGYIRYCGFDLQHDGSIILKLSKSIGA